LLHDQEHITLIVRLVLDRNRHITHGEVGGLGLEPNVGRWVAFRGPDGLLGAVQAWLAAS
jgi:hypothetical protein